METKKETKKNTRLLSLDTLRGFDMLFIMGFAPLVVALNALHPTAVGDVIAGHMRHVPWDGFTQHDMIFPLFLFIAGISFPFSLAKQRGSGSSDKHIYLRVFRRGVTLVLLGFLYNGFLQLNFPDVRLASVLGRIGLAWMFWAFIYMSLKKSVQYGLIVFILVGYWLLLAFVPAPDAAGASPLSIEGNLVGYIDRHCLPGKLIYGNFDPEGLLSTLPAIVTALLGIYAGEIVRSTRLGSGERKSLLLSGIGVVLVAIGLVWNTVFPINKMLWSSSFTCFVGGLSFLLFALFYYIVDVKGWKSWTLFFRVIGLNSITIYLAQQVVGFSHMNKFLFGGISQWVGECAGEPAGAVVLRAGYVACCWFFLYFLYRKNIFLKV